jgi:hypothetical protein
VKLVEPYSEADPAALLFEFLTMFGASVGRGPHARADAARHGAHFYVCLVGKTSRGRKGSAHARVKEAVQLVDALFVSTRVVSGLGSGEVVVQRVSDGRKKGKKILGRVADKRLLVDEPEFARILKVSQRDGSTLSPVLRTAWDANERLECTSKSAPDVATGAQVCVVAHVTRTELRRGLIETEAFNGFTNRFMFILVRRSKKLPEGADVPREALEAFAARVRERIEFVKLLGGRVLKRTPEAAAIWDRIYRAVPDDGDGLFDAATARAEAQMLRLSVAYALLDGCAEIRPEHVIAALAAWLYAQDSARCIFGESAGDPIADRLLEALVAAGEVGLDFEAQRDYFSRNIDKERLDIAREELERRGVIATSSEPTKGRPRIVTRYVGTSETTKDPLRAILDELSALPSFTASPETGDEAGQS